MNNDVLREGEGFDIVINGVKRLFADLEVSGGAASAILHINFPKA